jgi:hypothetical protein
MQLRNPLAILTVGLLLSSPLTFAGGHQGGGGGHRQIGQYSGFEGNEAVLGGAVAEAILKISPSKEAKNDFTDRELELGLAVSKTMKTLNVSSGYSHEMNDALVKMTLQFIQSSKDRGILEEIAIEDAETQMPMLVRVGKVIQKTGKKELALIAATDQTTCFYQLVGAVERTPTSITYRAPYGHVLEQTRRMGMHDLTEEEIHVGWTIPHIKVWSGFLGVELEITDWQEDGMFTISLPESEAMAAAH